MGQKSLKGCNVYKYHLGVQNAKLHQYARLLWQPQQLPGTFACVTTRWHQHTRVSELVDRLAD